MSSVGATGQPAAMDSTDYEAPGPAHTPVPCHNMTPTPTTFVTGSSNQAMDGVWAPSHWAERPAQESLVWLSGSHAPGACGGPPALLYKDTALPCPGKAACWLYAGAHRNGARHRSGAPAVGPPRGTHILSLNSNWNRLLVILAPLCPENTNILSRHTATGKLQQEGGISPLWATWVGEAAQLGPHGTWAHGCTPTPLSWGYIYS